MRMLLTAALAGSIGAVAIPASASAQSWGNNDYREYRRDVRQAQRECRRDLRRADSRREYNRELRDCRRDLREARRDYWRDTRDDRWRDNRYWYGRR